MHWAIDAYSSILTGEQGFGRTMAMQLGFGILIVAVTLRALQAQRPNESHPGER